VKQIKYVLAAVIVVIFLGGGFYVSNYFTERANKAEEIRKSEEALKQKVQELCKAGLELDWTKDYKAALSKFREADKLSPGNKEIAGYLNMITALIKLEEASVKVLPKEEPSVKVLPKEEPSVKVPTKEELALKERKEKELQETRMRKSAQRREQELRQNPQEFYNAARKLYRAKDYEAALSKFQEVQGVVPGYGKTAYFIKKISKVIERNETAKKAQKARKKKKALTGKVNELQKTALKLYRAKEYEAALGKFREIQNIAPGSSKADYFTKKIFAITKARGRAAEAREERERKKVAKEKARELYKSALKLYRAKDYEAALVKFQEMQTHAPGSLKAGYFIKRIRKIIERNKRAEEARSAREAGKAVQRKIKDLYKAGRALYWDKDYEAALEKFREVENMAPGYMQAASLIKKMPAMIEREERIKKAWPLYKEARDLYYAKDYEASLAKFREVDSTAPGYWSTSRYLKQIPINIKWRRKGKVREKQKIVPVTEKTTDYEREEKLARGRDRARAVLKDIEAKQAEKEENAQFSKVISEIDKLFMLAKEAEKRQDYEMVAEFYEKILALTYSDKKIRAAINDQKVRWAQEVRKRRKQGEPRSGSPEESKPVVAGTGAVAQKEERAVEAAAEREEAVAELAVSREASAPEPEERYFTLDLNQRISAGEYLVQQGESLLEEENFEEAYEAFTKAIEVMD